MFIPAVMSIIVDPKSFFNFFSSPDSILSHSLLIRRGYTGCMRNVSVNESPVSFSKAVLVSGAVGVGTCPAAWATATLGLLHNRNEPVSLSLTCLFSIIYSYSISLKYFINDQWAVKQSTVTIITWYQRFLNWGL